MGYVHCFFVAMQATQHPGHCTAAAHQPIIPLPGVGRPATRLTPAITSALAVLQPLAYAYLLQIIFDMDGTLTEAHIDFADMRARTGAVVHGQGTFQLCGAAVRHCCSSQKCQPSNALPH